MLIYCAKNIINNKVYIGKTKNSLEYRKKGHFDDAFKNESELKFHKALREFGINCFEWTIIFEDNSITVEELNLKEIEFIRFFDSINNGYNMCLGSNGGDLISKHPNKKEIIEKRTLKVKGKKRKKHTEETKRLISEKLKNKPNLKNRGKLNGVNNPGIKQKISIGIKNSKKWNEKIKSKEYSEKMSNSLKNSEKFQKSARSKEKSEKIKEKLTWKPTEEQIEQILFLYVEEQYAIVDIEKKLNISQYNISKTLKNNKVKIKHARRSKLV